MGNTKILGKRGERLAEEFLKAQGYKILERNFRVRSGEIDLIAQDRDCICFVEVKCRATSDVPQEAVSRSKQHKLTRLAQMYLKARFDSVDVRCRFDVVAVKDNADGTPQIEHFVDAFESV